MLYSVDNTLTRDNNIHGNLMEETMKAYLAGLLDGEGTICIVRSAHRTFMDGRKYPYYAVNIRIGMQNKEVIDLFHEQLKVGRLDLEKKYQYKRPMYRWRTSQKEEVVYVIETLLPYLRVKKANALLALEYIKNFVKHHLTNPMTEAEEQKRFGYWVKMRELNGIASPAETKPLGSSMSDQRPQQRTVRIEAIVRSESKDPEGDSKWFPRLKVGQ